MSLSHSCKAQGQAVPTSFWLPCGKCVRLLTTQWKRWIFENAFKENYTIICMHVCACQFVLSIISI